jgi:hypothetical protein
MGLPAHHRDAKDGTFHEALYLRRSTLKEVQIWQKPDQKFEKFATGWEMIWSRLVITWVAWRFLPVVDEYGTVIGHCGAVAGNNLLYDMDEPLSREPIITEFLKTNRLYVGTREFYRGKNYAEMDSRFKKFLVMTDIYGEVAAVTYVGYSSNNGEATSVSLVELMGWASLIRFGIEILITQIGKLGVRTITRFVPRALPPPPPPNLLKGGFLESMGASPRGPVFQSASAKTSRSVITAIRADVAESEAYKAALLKGEIGLQRSLGANVNGTDFITAVRNPAGQIEVLVTDVKMSTVGKFPKPSSTVPAAWRAEVEAAVAPGRLKLGDAALEEEIRAAVRANRVRSRQVNVDYSPAGQGQIRGL